MITRMHRLVLPLIIITLARSANAQAPTAATLDVTAQIINPITVASTHALDFGRMINASTKTVAANVATSGRVEISGMSGSALNVSVTLPTTLKATTGETIAVGSWIYILSPNATLVGGTTSSLTGGSPQTIGGTVLGGTTGVSKLYFGFGATLQTSATAPVGNYTATGQVTAAYADL